MFRRMAVPHPPSRATIARPRGAWTYGQNEERASAGRQAGPPPDIPSRAKARRIPAHGECPNVGPIPRAARERSPGLPVVSKDRGPYVLKLHAHPRPTPTAAATSCCPGTPKRIPAAPRTDASFCPERCWKRSRIAATEIWRWLPGFRLQNSPMVNRHPSRIGPTSERRIVASTYQRTAQTYAR